MSDYERITKIRQLVCDSRIALDGALAHMPPVSAFDKANLESMAAQLDKVSELVREARQLVYKVK
jgi:hypothetical protein